MRRSGRLARQLRCQLVQPQLLKPLADGVELGRAVGDQIATLAAELERLAQAGLAGVEPVDDLLQPLYRGLIAFGFLGHSLFSILASTPPSAKRSLTCSAATAAAASV